MSYYNVYTIDTQQKLHRHVRSTPSFDLPTFVEEGSASAHDKARAREEKINVMDKKDMSWIRKIVVIFYNGCFFAIRNYVGEHATEGVKTGLLECHRLCKITLAFDIGFANLLGWASRSR
jgi:hypothetical protein